MGKFVRDQGACRSEDSTSVPSEDNTVSTIASLEEDANEVTRGSLSSGEVEAESLPVVSSTAGNGEVLLFNFRPEGCITDLSEHRDSAEKYRLTFKQGKRKCRLVKNLLVGHGFSETDKYSADYNLCWMGSRVRPRFLSTMQSFQRVNHFPRSFEITRKDRLYKNVQKMQVLKGFKNFDFVPQTFLLPQEYQEFMNRCYKEKSTWIVKPTNLSRGRGIFLTVNPDSCMNEDKMVVCKYINNPLLIRGFKFDIRLYVAVTSFDPLVVYLYEEGLTRFATVPFNSSSKTIDDTYMHLTNYSINKLNSAFISNKDSEVEDHGNKWTLGALLRYLKKEGHDTTDLMMSIEDVIIKTMISGESSISSACKSFVNFKANCFELFGFDILLDENLKPWVLEVNLSPSLACDSPLDLKVKSHMMADLLNMIGVECQDPLARRNIDDLAIDKLMTSKKKKKELNTHQKFTRRLYPTCHHQEGLAVDPQQAPRDPLVEDQRMIRRFREENDRKGKWVRIFPTETTWDTYSKLFLDIRRSNIILHDAIKEERNDRRSATLCSDSSDFADSTESLSYELAAERCRRYERCLPVLGPSSSTVSLGRKRPRQKRQQQRSDKKDSSGNEKRKKKTPKVVAREQRQQQQGEEEEEAEARRTLAVGKRINLSYLQARKVFSMYLGQLMGPPYDQMLENMESVKMLNCSGQLNHAFKVREPAGCLTKQERRKQIEAQLKTFLLAFDKETLDIEKQQSQGSGGRSRPGATVGSAQQLDDGVLESFSQSDLEAAFNAYTELELSRGRLGTSHGVDPASRGSSSSTNLTLFSEDRGSLKKTQSSSYETVGQAETPKPRRGRVGWAWTEEETLRAFEGLSMGDGRGPSLSRSTRSDRLLLSLLLDAR